MDLAMSGGAWNPPIEWSSGQNSCEQKRFTFTALVKGVVALDLCYFPFLLPIVQTVFVVLLLARIAVGSRRATGGRGKLTDPELRMVHVGARRVSLGLSIIYGALLLWKIWNWKQVHWTRAPIRELVFYGTQAVIWLITVIVLGREQAEKRDLYSAVLKIWWLVTLIVSIAGVTVALVKGSYRCFDSIFDAALLCLPTVASAFFVAASCAGFMYSRHPAVSADRSAATTPLLHTEKESAHPDVSRKSGLSTAGWLGKITFSWLNPLLTAGNKKPLTIDDVPPLDVTDNNNENYELFRRAWEEEKLRASVGTRPSIERALWKVFWKPFLLSLALMISWATAIFTGPLLQNVLVTYMNTENRLLGTGMAIVGSLFVGKVVEGLCKHHFGFLARRLGLRMWAAVGCAVYKKTLVLSQKARQGRSVGEVTNILSADVQRLLEFTRCLQQGLAIPYQLMIASVILFQVVGVSVMCGFFTLAVVMCINISTINSMRRYKIEVLQAKDKRLQATMEVLSNVKVIKLQAWDERFKKKIIDLREIERKALLGFNLSWSFSIFCTWSSPLLVSTATFFSMALLGQKLTTARVFTALTTIRTIQEPVRTISDSVSSIIQGGVSFQRIRDFLCDEEVDMDAVEVVPDDSPYAVGMHAATFSWAKSHAVPAISDLNLQINKGDCVAVCGGVGSGKSGLLYSILGELPKLIGTAKRSGRVAYVAQSAWIQNKTIRENILFGRVMERKRYDEAIRVSCLDTDLAMLPYGDRTELGEHGINISGGQKQRIQLARAVYQDADIYLLDDPFSAVDAHTGKHLFQECIRGALRGKTVILVTHQLEFLSLTDKILVMKGGRVVQEGSYDELVAEGKEFSTFFGSLRESLDTVKSADHQSSYLTQSSVKLVHRRREEVCRSDSNSDPQNASSRKRSASESKANKGRLIADEESGQGRMNRTVVWTYITRIWNGVAALATILLQFLAIYSQIGSDYWMAYGTSSGNADGMGFLGVYAAFGAAVGVAVLARVYLVGYVGVRTAQAFFTTMLTSIMRAPMSYLDSTPHGRIISRSSTDQSNLDLDLPVIVCLVNNMAICLITFLVVPVVVKPYTAVIVFPLVYVYFRLQKYYLKSARELSMLTAITEAPVFLHLSESIAGATTIRAFDVRAKFMATNSDRLHNYQRAYFHNSTAISWLGLRLESFGTFILLAATIISISAPANSISPGMAGIILDYGLTFSGLLVLLVNACSQFENKIVSVERLTQYSNIPSEGPAVIEDRRPGQDWPNAGRLELENLQIRYRPENPLVLKGISCVIHPREKVGIVGRTGSGKSTLIQAIFRLIEPSGGRIIIDGLDITTIGLKDLRSRLGVIPQEPTLFEGTIRSNMDPFGMHSDQELWETLEKCTLARTIRNKPDKLDTAVVVQGQNWSVGERQLLCLGRVLLGHARILVLDEATASVDISTDAFIHNTIKKNFADCTVLSVAHRIPTVIDCDRILVLDAGHLMENDSPEHLLAQDSLFSMLVQEYTSREIVSSNLKA